MEPQEQLEAQGGAGCGLAAYGMLLLLLFSLGLVGIAMSTWNMLSTAGSTSPFELLSGSEVQEWRLLPMREAGLLAPGELPAAWHDESADMSGSTACALTASEVLRVEEGVGKRLAFDQIAKVELLRGAAGEVVVMEARQGEGVGCRFRPDEGGNRFLRQIQVELLRVERGG